MKLDELLAALPVDDGGGGLVRVADLAQLVSEAWEDAAVGAAASTTWLTVTEARRWWRDAPADDEQLTMLLDMAQEQVLAYGPESVAAGIAVDGIVPKRYRIAQLTQSRNIWNATKTDPATGGIGDEGFIIRPFPLDWTVKNMVRPVSAKPVVA